METGAGGGKTQQESAWVGSQIGKRRNRTLALSLPELEILRALVSLSMLYWHCLGLCAASFA